VFDTRVRDLIVLELIDPLAFTYQALNVERARIRGAELSWSAVLGEWRVNAGATVQDPRNDSTGARLARRARTHFDLRAAWQRGSLQADATVLVSGDREDVSFPANVLLPGYTLLNAAFGYRLGRDWLLQARVDNVLDRRYQLVYGYHTPQRSFLLTARYRKH
jgi:vitamin B12 transporter